MEGPDRSIKRLRTSKASACYLLPAVLVKCILEFCNPFQIIGCQGVNKAWQTVITEHFKTLFRHMDLSTVDKLGQKIVKDDIDWVHTIRVHGAAHVMSVCLPLRCLLGLWYRDWTLATTPNLRKIQITASHADDVAELMQHRYENDTLIQNWIIQWVVPLDVSQEFEFIWPPGCNLQGSLFRDMGEGKLPQLSNLLINGSRVGACQHNPRRFAAILDLGPSPWKYQQEALFVDQSGQLPTGHGTCSTCIPVCHFCWRASSKWQVMMTQSSSCVSKLTSWKHDKQQTLFHCRLCTASACWTCINRYKWRVYSSAELEPEHDCRIICHFHGDNLLLKSPSFDCQYLLTNLLQTSVSV